MGKDISYEKKSTSSAFLSTRIGVNDTAERDFDEWSLGLMPPVPLNAKIFDLGCGTGKQVNLFSDVLGKDAMFYALDLSDESVARVKSEYKASPKLKVVCDTFENFDKYIDKADKDLDLIYSFYALYYTRDLPKLFKMIYDRLGDGGVFWSVGPHKGTNKELVDIVSRLYKIEEKILYSINNFYRDMINLSGRIGFKRIKADILKNRVSFHSKEALFKYLSNSSLYNAEYSTQIDKALTAAFDGRDTFTLTKNVLSLKMWK